MRPPVFQSQSTYYAEDPAGVPVRCEFVVIVAGKLAITMKEHPANTKQSLSPLTVAAAYIGTVVGAGFATGQEVLQFFGFHGATMGLVGLGLSTALFVVYGGMILNMGHSLQANSHLEVVRRAGGKWVGLLMDGVITFFLAGAFATMAAGSGAVFEEQFGLSAVVGSLLMVVASIATVLLGIRGVVSAISYVVPFLLAAVLSVSVYALVQEPVNWQWARPADAAVGLWPVAGVAYASYNLLLAISVLAPMGKLADRKTLKLGALWGGLGLGLGAAAIHLAVLTRVPEIASYEIPMLFLARKLFAVFPVLYTIVLLAEVYTTAVGSLYGFAARLTNPEGPRFATVTVATGVVAFLGSRVGFSELVSTIYSAVGYAGFALLLALSLRYFGSQREAGETSE